MHLQLIYYGISIYVPRSSIKNFWSQFSYPKGDSLAHQTACAPLCDQTMNSK